MGRKRVSVVMPNYNCARYLPEAIESVLRQSYRNIELIVIDDGSSDDSVAVIQQYKDAVKLIRLPHSGLPGLVRNRGLEVASGALIAFHDADDVWKEKKLDVQVDYLERHRDVGFVHSNLEVIDAEGRYIREFYLGCAGSRGLSDDYGEDSFTQLIKGDSGVATPTVLLKRECLNRVGLFDESLPITEDWHLWVRIAKVFEIGFIEQSLAKHRVHGANWGRSWTPLEMVPGVELWKKILKLYPEIGQQYPEIIHAKFVLHHLFAGLRCLKRGYYNHGTQMLLKSLALNPFKMGSKELRRNISKFRTIRRLKEDAVSSRASVE